MLCYQVSFSSRYFAIICSDGDLCLTGLRNQFVYHPNSIASQFEAVHSNTILPLLLSTMLYSVLVLSNEVDALNAISSVLKTGVSVQTNALSALVSILKNLLVACSSNSLISETSIKVQRRKNTMNKSQFGQSAK